MDTIQWNDKLSVKIDSIDFQHKKIIEVINNFYQYISDGTHKEKYPEIIKALKEYTLYHFSTEEKYMKQHQFPGMEAHVKEHKEFINKVLDLDERITSGKLVISLEITNFIKNWVVSHIMGTDQKYSDFLRERGVK